MKKSASPAFAQALFALAAVAAVSVWSYHIHRLMLTMRTGVFAPGRVLQRNALNYAVPVAAMLLLALLERAVFRTPLPSSLGLAPKQFLPAMKNNALILPALLIGAAVSSFLRLTFGTWDRGYSPWLQLPVQAIVAVSEELIFRGYAQPRFAKLFGGWGGVALSAFLFATVHLPDQIFIQRTAAAALLARSALMFAGGLLLGALAKRDKSVWGAVPAHWALNMCGVY
ncbi:MAG: CPBP family intramembrane metalloprotease [Oscillospiraceae bacterium]|jgi:membrane protease YdiL (CAAX protease family)|nr:CPBP family intramembrane metalloprotease [Oscillospiraceae bacterium]